MRCTELGRSVPDDTLFAYHARLPRRTLRDLAVPFAGTVPSVLSSDTVESLLILIYAFSGLQLGSWLPSWQPPFGQLSLCSSAIVAFESGVTAPGVYPERSRRSLQRVLMLRVPLRTLRVPIASGSSPRIHALRLPVYTSSATFFTSVLGDSML